MISQRPLLHAIGIGLISLSFVKGEHQRYFETLAVGSRIAPHPVTKGTSAYIVLPDIPRGERKILQDWLPQYQETLIQYFKRRRFTPEGHANSVIRETHLRAPSVELFLEGLKTGGPLAISDALSKIKKSPKEEHQLLRMLIQLAFFPLNDYAAIQEPWKPELYQGPLTIEEIFLLLKEEYQNAKNDIGVFLWDAQREYVPAFCLSSIRSLSADFFYNVTRNYGIKGAGPLNEVERVQRFNETQFVLIVTHTPSEEEFHEEIGGQFFFGHQDSSQLAQQWVSKVVHLVPVDNQIELIPREKKIPSSAQPEVVLSTLL